MFLRKRKKDLFEEIKDVEGWVSYSTLLLLPLIAKCLSANKITGDCIEIGVHHGKFLIALERITPRDVSVYGVDVFEHQHLNVDASGSGNKDLFIQNIKNFCHYPDRVTPVHSDSFDIHQTPFFQETMFSIVSIDGGHTVHHTVYDLRQFETALAPGGIVILDDFLNPEWLGVTEGLTRYLTDAGCRLAPFMVGHNKIYLTTISYQQIFFSFFLQNLKAAENIGVTRLNSNLLCGWPMLIYNGTDKPGVEA